MNTVKQPNNLLRNAKYAVTLILAFSLSSCPSVVSGSSVKSTKTPSVTTGPKTFTTAPTSVSQATQVSFPWISYFGSYNSPANWANAVRGIGRGETGKSNSDNAPFVQEINTVVGAQQRTAMLPIGGLNSAKIETESIEYFNQIRKDKAKQWKDIVYKQALRLAKVPNATEKVYWQVGNEINSAPYSKVVQLLEQNPDQRRGRPNDPQIIPYYVEYYLAPSVESLRKVSQDLYKSDDKIKIALGSVANASNPASIQWLNSLLSYKVRGDFAPSLAGKQVKDLVNVVTIHYLLTVGDNSWRSTLDSLWTQWVGQGRISGVWLTEEIGKLWAYSGRGAATALKVTARYLDWTGNRGLTPVQGRAFMWGENISRAGTNGTSGEYGMTVLYNFLGNSPVKRFPQPVTLDSSTGLESFIFQSSTNPSKKVIFIYPSSAEAPQSLDKPRLNEREQRREEVRARQRERMRRSGELEAKVVRSFQNFSIKVDKPSETISATMHVFSPSGHTQTLVPVTKNSNSYRFSPGRSVPLPDQSVALFLIEEK